MDRLTVTGYYRRPAHLVAQAKGFFARENLDVQFHLVDIAPDHNREMAEGKWNMTLSSADTMLARATQDGVDYVMFMQAEEGLNVQFVAQPEIRSFADLRGKLIAADPIDSNFDLVRNKIMLDNGIPEKAANVLKMERFTSKGRYYSLFLFMVAGMNGVVVTGDLFNLYVFMEIASIASYALVVMIMFAISSMTISSGSLRR